MRIPCNSYQVFGSGGGAIKLRIDGKSPSQLGLPIMDDGDNGFVGTVVAEVSIDTLLAAREVKFSEWHDPGGSREFKGSGRHFVKWFLRKGYSEDPLRFPRCRRYSGQRVSDLARLAGPRETLTARENRAFADEIIARIQTGELTWDGRYFCDRSGVQQASLGNFCGHSGPEWRRVLAARDLQASLRTLQARWTTGALVPQ